MTPTDILEDEHKLIERVVQVIASTAENLKRDQQVPVDLLQGIVKFMQEFVTAFHQEREDSILFDFLEQKGVPEHGCPLAPLQNEHQKVRAVMAELSDAVAAYQASDLGKERVAQGLVALTQIYPQHLWIENFLLFPMTNKLLNTEERTALKQKLGAVKADRDQGVHQDAIKRVEELESTAARLTQRTTLAAVPTPDAPQRPPEAKQGTVIQFNLSQEADRLRHEPAWTHGRNAKTLIKFSDLRVVLTTVRAGQKLTDHRNPGRICIQPLSGHIRVEALGKAYDLPAGRIVAIDREVPHHITAVDDSTFMVTVAWPSGHEKNVTAPVA